MSSSDLLLALTDAPAQDWEALFAHGAPIPDAALLALDEAEQRPAFYPWLRTRLEVGSPGTPLPAPSAAWERFCTGQASAADAYAVALAQQPLIDPGYPEAGVILGGCATVAFQAGALRLGTQLGPRAALVTALSGELKRAIMFLGLTMQSIEGFKKAHTGDTAAEKLASQLALDPLLMMAARSLLPLQQDASLLGEPLVRAALYRLWSPFSLPSVGALPAPQVPASAELEREGLAARLRRIGSDFLASELASGSSTVAPAAGGGPTTAQALQEQVRGLIRELVDASGQLDPAILWRRALEQPAPAVDARLALDAVQLLNKVSPPEQMVLALQLRRGCPGGGVEGRWRQEFTLALTDALFALRHPLLLQAALPLLDELLSADDYRLPRHQLLLRRANLHIGLRADQGEAALERARKDLRDASKAARAASDLAAEVSATNALARIGLTAEGEQLKANLAESRTALLVLLGEPGLTGAGKARIHQQLAELAHAQLTRAAGAEQAIGRLVKHRRKSLTFSPADDPAWPGRLLDLAEALLGRGASADLDELGALASKSQAALLELPAEEQARRRPLLHYIRGRTLLARSEAEEHAAATSREGELAEARRQLERAVALLPDQPSSTRATFCFFLARALAARGEAEPARTRYQQAWEESRSAGGVTFQESGRALGRLWNQAQQPHRAVEVLRQTGAQLGATPEGAWLSLCALASWPVAEGPAPEELQAPLIAYMNGELPRHPEADKLVPQLVTRLGMGGSGEVH